MPESIEGVGFFVEVCAIAIHKRLVMTKDDITLQYLGVRNALFVKL
jgi:hypothetical protein